MEKSNKKNFNWERIENSVPFCVKVYEIILTTVLIATFVGVMISLKINQIVQINTLSLFNLAYISGPFIIAFIIFSCIYNVKNLSDHKVPKLSFISLEDLVYASCILLIAISLSFLDEILPLIKEATSTKMLAEKIIYTPDINYILLNIVFWVICIYFMNLFNKKKLNYTVGVWISILGLSFLFKVCPEIGKIQMNCYVLYILVGLYFLALFILCISSPIRGKMISMKEKMIGILFLVGVAVVFLVSFYHPSTRIYLAFLALIIFIIWLILNRKKIKEKF